MQQFLYTFYSKNIFWNRHQCWTLALNLNVKLCPGRHKPKYVCRTRSPVFPISGNCRKTISISNDDKRVERMNACVTRQSREPGESGWPPILRGSRNNKYNFPSRKHRRLWFRNHHIHIYGRVPPERSTLTPRRPETNEGWANNSSFGYAMNIKRIPSQRPRSRPSGYRSDILSNIVPPNPGLCWLDSPDATRNCN